MRIGEIFRKSARDEMVAAVPGTHTESWYLSNDELRSFSARAISTTKPPPLAAASISLRARIPALTCHGSAHAERPPG